MVCRCKNQEEHASRAVSYEQSRHTNEVKDLQKQIRELFKEKERGTVDSANFIVEDATERAGYLVLKLLYTHGPDCKPLPDCTFEGHKILVFKNATLREAIKWKRIDPHFREGTPPNSYTAPSPIARFIGNDEGWKMAMKFLEGVV